MTVKGKKSDASACLKICAGDVSLPLIFFKNSIPLMGKGDYRSKRGKIRRGSNGKSRPNPRKNRAAFRKSTAAAA